MPLRNFYWTGLAAVLSASCGEADPTLRPNLGETTRSVAPAGSAATIVSNTIPTTLSPGERLVVQVVTQNTGTVDWSDASQWGLQATNFSFGWADDFIDAPVAQGGTSTHNIRITAPASSTTFGAQVYSYIPAQSGPVMGGSLTVPVTVDPAATPRWGCGFESTTIPSSVVAGSIFSADVSVRNTGSETWPGGGELCLYAREDADSTSPSIVRWGSAICSPLASSVAPNATATFTFNVTAPAAPGTYRFMRQMLDTRSVDAGGVGFFRATDLCVDETITVVAGAPTLDAVVVSDTIPATAAPGDILNVSVVMQNTGTETWTPGSTYVLYSENTPITQWGFTSINVPTTVAQGQTATFTFPMTVPATTGAQSLEVRMLKSGFGSFGATLSRTVNVSAMSVPTVAASVTGDTFPASMAPNSSETVTVTMRNDGTQTWTPGAFFLVSTNSPATLWQTTSVDITASVPSGSTYTFTFPVTAPNQTGTEAFRFRMFGNGVGLFGSEVNEPVTLSGAITPPYGAEVVSQTIPSTLVANAPATFTITMRNTGTQSWPANGNIDLRSNNTPFTLFNATTVPLTADVATNGTFSFTFTAVAPAAPGTYTSNWRMHQSGGISYFGSAATQALTVTASPGCGDGTVSGSETCDDGNTTAGDGCGASCQIEPRTVDLASGPANRTFYGVTGNRQLTSVVIADLTGDGRAEVLMSDFTDIGELGIIRNEAGRVYVYSGGPSFFTGTAGAVNAAPLITLWGRDPGDWLGGLAGGVRVADVTGDGSVDVVAGAQFADGTGNARGSCGEIYVFRGGGTLTSGGIFDLANTSTTGVSPASTIRGAVITGAAADDRLSVLALGDVTGDGVADVIAGSPRASVNGTNSGAVYVIAGGSQLASTSTVDLASATIAARIVGPGASAFLGAAAAVGNVVGSAANDLVVSAPNFSTSGRVRNGVVYVLEGPLSGTYNLGGTFSGATIIGEGDHVIYGSDIAIADVAGTPDLDLVIGSGQALANALQSGEVHVWLGPLTTGVVDNAVTSESYQIFGELFDYLGGSVEAADTNGDGVADLLFGAGLADGEGDARLGSGEVGVVLGGPGLVNSIRWAGFVAPFRIYGEADYDFLGLQKDSVAAGDIDGDGRADWCVGAQLGGDSVASGAGRIDCFQSPW